MTKTEITGPTFPRDEGDALLNAVNPLFTPEYVLALSDEEKLAALADIAKRAAGVVEAQVVRMRTGGIRGYGRYAEGGWTPLSDRFTWSEIGAALGLSSSTAQNRYKHVAPRERTR